MKIHHSWCLRRCSDSKPAVSRLARIGTCWFKHKQITCFFPLAEKRELLEIAKANAAKALGTDNIVLPASLKILTPSKEIKNEIQEHEDAGESAEVSTDLEYSQWKGKHFLKLVACMDVLVFNCGVHDYEFKPLNKNSRFTRMLKTVLETTVDFVLSWKYYGLLRGGWPTAYVQAFQWEGEVNVVSWVLH